MKHYTSHSHITSMRMYCSTYKKQICHISFNIIRGLGYYILNWGAEHFFHFSKCLLSNCMLNYYILSILNNLQWAQCSVKHEALETSSVCWNQQLYRIHQGYSCVWSLRNSCHLSRTTQYLDFIKNIPLFPFKAENDKHKWLSLCRCTKQKKGYRKPSHNARHN